MSIDPRLRVPLTELWSDVRVPGLPVYHLIMKEQGILSPEPDRVISDQRYYPTKIMGDDGGAFAVDLSRPGASDILARRVATAAGLKITGGARWSHHHPDPHKWRIDCPGVAIFSYQSLHCHWVVPDLEGVDGLHDDTRLDWGNLGSPRVVDLVALGLVAQHLFTQEQK